MAGADKRRILLWEDFARSPVVASFALAAIAVSIAWWAKADVSMLFENAGIRRGELWRLFTNVFPHLNLLHLAFDVYWLWIFGSRVERIYGHSIALALLVFFAVGTSSVDFALASGGVGLSGVGYGLFGLLWILSDHDDRFRGAIDKKTVALFVGWFLLCVATTVTGVMPVANVAHGAGIVLGVLTGFAITLPARRLLCFAGMAAVLLFGLWGSTLGRPLINLSRYRGYDEGKRGYEALLAGHNGEALRWLRDAVKYQPKMAVYWFNLGIAYQRQGKLAAAKEAYQRAHQLDPADSKYSETVAEFQ
jgi:membrane associated rhomboid family serine protease